MNESLINSVIDSRHEVSCAQFDFITSYGEICTVQAKEKVDILLSDVEKIHTKVSP